MSTPSEKLLFSEIFQQMGIPPPPPPPQLMRQPAITENTIRQQKRCGECKKKLMLSDLTCTRCCYRYCGAHRLPEEHHCGFDFQTEGRELLTAANPVVRADKMSSRI